MIFKVRHKKTGLFAATNSWQDFTKRGKVWKMKHAAIERIRDDVHRKKYRAEDVELVTYELVETEAVCGQTVRDEREKMIEEREARAAEAAKAQKILQLEQQKARLEKELKEMRKKRGQ